MLEDYSLRVKPGELATLSGASGQGKTTVLRLIAGLLTPERGTVTIAGMAPRAAQSRVAYLPQDAYLLEGSLTYRHGDETHLLKAGDALTFSGEVPHGPEKLIKTPIRMLSVIIYAESGD